MVSDINLISKIEVVSTKLKEETSNSNPLRELLNFIKKEIKECDIDSETDESILFQIFFLEIFLEKVFYNLTGNVPYIEGVTKEIQIRFYGTIGNILYELSQALRTKNHENLYAINIKFGLTYLEAKNQLNRVLNNRERASI